MDEMLSISMSDGGESSHTAGGHHHAGREEGAAGHGGALIVGRVMAIRHLLDLFERIGCFVDQSTGAPFAENQMRFDARTRKRLHEADSVDRSRGAADTDNQPS